ncbi:MAG: lactate utilization protein [Treponema sp.]|jgi:L-lactate utilization protein LutB|nr:lactate utilization protein [Treponema sp.]
MREKEEAIQKQFELSAAHIVKNLQSRKFEAYYCGTGEEAAEKALSLIPEKASVSWGGSVTIYETGLVERLYKTDRAVIDRDRAKTNEERTDLMRRALLCDVFLTSANAISEDGVLVHIDGLGNRVAAVAFGPKSVIVIVGMNKVCKTIGDARNRARNYAAPVNALRIFKDPPGKTPCSITGICADCKSDDCICSSIVETRMCKPPGRIKIILVGESLGF